MADLGKYGKDAYYFPHDSNAKDDPKCVILIETMGVEGYGIFWILIEILREQKEYRYPLAAVPGIARRYSTTTEKIKSVIQNFSLFEIDEQMFFAPTLTKRMSIIDGRRHELSEAGKRGNQKRWSKNSHPIATQSQVKDSKGEESKGNETIIPVKDNFYTSKDIAFHDMKVDELYLEECHRTITGKGWRAATKVHTLQILRSFLISKADLNNEKTDVRRHFKNFLFREKLNNLIQITENER